MAAPSPVRVFIGSGEVSRLERKTLIHSLRRNSKRELDIYVINGTHNTLERNDEPPVPAPLSLDLKYRNYTEFSLYRYLIPEICNHEGRAIHLDSDMICIDDIGNLFDLPMDECDFLATRAYARDEWATSVMLIDCQRCRFDLAEIYREIDAGVYSYSDFSRMNPRFRERHPYRVGAIDPKWNVFDRHDAETHLIHYTELLTQPWRKAGHPYGDIWFKYFKEAMSAGLINDEDIHVSIMRGHARPDIRLGNLPGPIQKALLKLRMQVGRILEHFPRLRLSRS